MAEPTSVFLQPNVASGRGGAFSRWFWTVAIAAGVLTGLGAGALMRLLRLVQHAAYGYRAGDFEGDVMHVTWLHRFAVMTFAGLLAGAAGVLIRSRAGGRAGDMNSMIWFHDGTLAPRPTTARAVLSIVLVGLGASLGREQAPKQVGAVLASLGSIWFGLHAAERRLLVACGAGAGVAAVYDVPFGGALFALEVLLGAMTLPLVAPALVMSSLATVAAWTLLPDRATYLMPVHTVDAATIVFALVASPLCGLASVGFTRAICWADARKPSGWRALATPVLVFAALGALAGPYPGLLGNGRDLAQACFSGSVAPALLIALVLLKPLATAACLASGAPGGLFTPTIAFGALFGALLGVAAPAFIPGIDPRSAALLGAAGILAGTSLAPISSLVLILELTRAGAPLLIPLVLMTAGTVTLARLIEPRSTYSGRLHLGRDQVEPGSGRISSAARLPEIMCRILQDGALTVIDEHGKAIGRITPEELTREIPLGPTAAIANAGDFVRADLPTETTDADSRSERITA